MRTLCLLLLCCMALLHANGQPGSLEPSFGNKGIQTTFFTIGNFLNEQGKAVLINANGDIFVVLDIGSIVKYLPDGKLDSSYGNAGYSNRVNISIASAVFQGDKIVEAGSSNGNFAITRYTANGTLDSSFGVNGIVTGPEGGANAIALQGDKIVAAGHTGNADNYGISDFALTRYTDNGTLDSSFGVKGIVTGPEGGANAIALQGDKIVVAGETDISYSHYGNFVLARYTANGTLDSSFGVKGIVTGPEGGANAIALQGDKIIVAGETGYFYVGDNRDFALARYAANGLPDSSFGENGNGLVTTDFNGNDDFAKAIALQDGKIIVAGYTYIPGYFTSDFALARFTTNGTLDPSFGVNGKVTDQSGQANALAIQDDKIVLAGYSSGDFVLARYTTNGGPDSSFGVNGKLTGYLPSTTTYFTSTIIQGNKIIAAGYALNDKNNNDFALARYMADGTLDTSFGVHGKVTTDFNSLDDQANAIAMQGDKFIVAGSSGYYDVYDNYISDFALARYTADGILDSSFGKNGIVITDLNDIDEVHAMAVQGDKIIVGGYSNVGSYGPYLGFNPLNSTSDFVLARYTADGALDTSFGDGGKVGGPNTTVALAIQGDKIIVAGNSKLARYTTDGRLDSSFGVNGAVAIYFNGNNDVANTMALQGNKIIVAGSTTNPVNNNSDFALARYTTNGTLDASFGVNGKVTTDFNDSNDIATSIVVQGDKIIVGGYTDNSSYRDFALAQYTVDGALDSSFGVNGKVITDLGGSAFIQGIALQQNRLYAVGSLKPVSTYDTYGVVAAYQLEATGPTICLSDVTVCESQKQAVVTVRLSAPSTQAVQVDYHTHYITAHPTRDYLSTKYTLQFAAGTTTAKVKIPIVDDSVCEPTEQFEVILRYPQHATIKDSIGIVTIKDDDCTLTTMQQSSGQEKVQISTALSITASPNPSAGAFTVQLHGSNLKQQVSIRVYDVSGRLMEEREHISIGQVLHLGNQYKAGTYIIEAMQGTRRVQIKVIKTGK
jgi:uncharacterized delta-60 repeat protein